MESEPSHKLRLSHTLLNLWMQGKTDAAISTYFHLDTFVSPAMEQGRKYHKEMEEYVKTNKKLPDWLPQIPLVSPITEIKQIVSYNEIFNLSGIFDLLGGDTLYELKTGSTDIMEWASSYQIPFYFLMAKRLEIDIKRAYLLHYDPFTKQKEFLIIHNNDKAIADVENMIESVGYEMREHFIKEGLI